MSNGFDKALETLGNMNYMRGRLEYAVPNDLGYLPEPPSLLDIQDAASALRAIHEEDRALIGELAAALRECRFAAGCGDILKNKPCKPDKACPRWCKRDMAKADAVLAKAAEKETK